MKLTILIFILIIFSSCQAKDFKAQINLALNKKDIPKVEKLLSEYYQINGTDELLERSYIKLAIIKNNLQDILKKYQNTKYMSIKKDKDILNGISEIIIKANKKITIKKRIKFYKNTLKAFPYSEKIYNEYLTSLLKLKKTNEALKVYLQFDELFNKNNKYLKDILFFKLKNLYKETKKVKILNLIAKLDNKYSNDFLKNEITKNKEVFIYIQNLPKNFDMDVIKNFISSSNFLHKKHALYLFIEYGSQEDVKHFINKIYPHITNKGLKIFIYKNYYKRFKLEIDKKLIKNLLKDNELEYFKAGIKLIKDLKLKKYTNDLKEILGSPQKFKCGNGGKILSILFDLDKEYALNFIKNIKNISSNDLNKYLKRQSALIALKQKVDCKKCFEILKNKEFNEETKSKALTLLIKSKENISFFNQYDNIIYYNILLEYHKYLDNNFLEKLAFTGLKKWKDERMIIYYLNRLNVHEIDEYFMKKKIKDIKDQYFMKIIYFSVILQKTNNKNDKFKKFILNKNFFRKEYIKLYQFNASQINILIKLYILEHRNDMKIEIIEKIIETLNK